MSAFLLSLALLATTPTATPAPAPTQAAPAQRTPAQAAEREAAMRDAQQAAQAKLFYGEDRSAATKASNPERWGLQARDLSVGFDEAIAQKAGLPARWAEVKAAAKSGDAFAQLLAALYLRLPMGGKDEKKAQAQFKLAADQGLVRALAETAAYAWDIAETDEESEKAGYDLSALWNYDNAHARYLVAIRGLESGNALDGLQALQYSARAGHAPSLLAVAVVLPQLRKPPSEQVRNEAHALARRAAAMGLPAAEDYLKQHPTP